MFKDFLMKSIPFLNIIFLFPTLNVRFSSGKSLFPLKDYTITHKKLLGVVSLERIARKIPASLLTIASEKLIDVVLNSSNADKMPSDLAKTILYYWQRDQLKTEIGMQRLLEASMLVNAEQTIATMESLGLPELVIMLKEKQV